MASLDHAARRFILIEGLKGLMISGVISLFFAFLMFGGRESVPLKGLEGVIFDAFPQSVMIMLLGSVVPALLVRNAVIKGGEGWRDSGPPSAGGTIVRVVPWALLIAGSGILAHFWALPHLSPEIWDRATVLLFKTVYGACLGGFAALIGVHAVLRR